MFVLIWWSNLYAAVGSTPCPLCKNWVLVQGFARCLTRFSTLASTLIAWSLTTYGIYLYRTVRRDRASRLHAPRRAMLIGLLLFYDIFYFLVCGQLAMRTAAAGQVTSGPRFYSGHSALHVYVSKSTDRRESSSSHPTSRYVSQ